MTSSHVDPHDPAAGRLVPRPPEGRDPPRSPGGRDASEGEAVEGVVYGAGADALQFDIDPGAPEHSHGPEGARLADVIAARREGVDPNAEAAARRADRRRRTAVQERARARWRLHLLCFAFLLAYASVAGRMALIAGSEPEEPRASFSAPFSAARAEITDRNGELLAANIPVWSLYAHPEELLDKQGAAEKLAAIFPDLTVPALMRQFNDGRRFLWLKKAITPAQRVQVHDIGDPGLQFGRRDMRVYPGGRLASHILGGASFGKEGVTAAEIVGVGGVESKLDEALRDPARASEPMRLSIDMRVQRAFTDVLRANVEKFHARGAAGVLMDANTGEVIALASLPDFDPNDRPPPPTSGLPDDYATFNRAAQGVYELGSTFKIFNAAMAMEAGIATPQTMIDTTGPMHWGRFKISDAHAMPARMTLREVIIESSNTGSARLALQAGAKRQRAFLETLGLLESTPVELSEAGRADPLLPARWSEISTMTISYGHGLAVTPLHLAAAYASITNGGLRVKPTLLAGAPGPDESDRVVSEQTSDAMREMLRAVVTEGTGRNADVEGYFLGGKTGSAEKPRRNGVGYDKTKVLATFAGVFPAHDPAYVIVVTLDEGWTEKYGRRWRTAGWTAAPTVKDALTRIAPILGMRPQAEPTEGDGPAGARQVASR
ncbi:penicillin-binding protein 2 [uncultured Albimonas sp.]|uniref:peptidoglycan D,D-transpeptidase FtsI family protein n=1 Tax=uncultured Albimonas sp. TaxID=1331701 RepID=UPI0030EB2747|tara:strand:- start:4168 stop:6156 length:1989 start_codon:yes stop_codon:yes gene_type:complete